VESRLATAARDTAGNPAPVAKWILPVVLREISGLALTADGRILAHNDERGRVYVIDPRQGVIRKQFSIGERGVIADFEAIAVSGDFIYLLASNGDIYQFREGEDGANVPFTMHDTKLGKECEFEGLEIEAGSGAFLLACKNISKKSERNQLLIYRWLPPSGGAAQVSTISIPLADAIGANGWKSLSPSDIARDPRSGNYVIITGPEKALIEITAQGEVVRSMAVPGNPQQPEGVAISREGILMIADEGVVRAADITLYPWRPGQAQATAAPAADSVQPADAPAARN
jgi:uncharacterized protein YjiK